MKRPDFRLVLVVVLLLLAATEWLPRLAVDVIFTVLNVAVAAWLLWDWRRDRRRSA